MKKKNLLLCVLLLLCLAILSGCPSQENENLEFSVLPDGTYGVGIGDLIGQREIVIPATYDGKTVTKILENGFQNASNLTSIVIPDGVTGIGNGAFSGCTSLTSVDLPNSVTEIGDLAFSDCGSLASVVVGRETVALGDQVFTGCTGIKNASIPAGMIAQLPKGNLQSVVISGGEIIEESAFAECKTLKTLTIEDGIVEIEDAAFLNCMNLVELTMSDSVMFIAENAFEGCTFIQTATIPAEAGRFIPKHRLKTLVIRGGSVIGSYAFENSALLNCVTVEKGIDGIGKGAFANCNQLEYLSVPFVGGGEGEQSVNRLEFIFLTKDAFKDDDPNDGVYAPDTEFVPESLKTVVVTGSTKIYSRAFADCKYIETIVLSGPIETIADSAFYSCSSLKNVTLPETLTSIGGSAFYRCKSLESLEIPDGVTSIGDHIFLVCSSLKCVNLPKSLTYLGWDAFVDCVSLETIVVPEGIIAIGDETFRGCKSLTSIALPSTVESFGIYVFSGATSLTNITVSTDNPYFASVDGNLYDKNQTTLIQYAVGKKDSSFSIPESVTTIGENAFANNDHLTCITIHNRVTSIDSSAFYACNNIEQATLPVWALSYISKNSLKAVVINGGDSIPEQAFANCPFLKSITVSEGVTSITSSAFFRCNDLRAAVLPRSLASIGESAFYECKRFSAVYYNGTASDWANINIASKNVRLEAATVYFYTETQPTTEGNYWHYVDGAPTAW